MEKTHADFVFINVNMMKMEILESRDQVFETWKKGVHAFDTSVPQLHTIKNACWNFGTTWIKKPDLDFVNSCVWASTSMLA